MSCFKGFLCYDGNEVVNHAQTITYLTAMGHPGVKEPMRLDCICDGLGSGPDGTGAYTLPATDDAWWYDVAVPESADVIGLWVEDFTISSPYKKEAKEKLFGAALGGATYGKRDIVITGWVLTRSDRATSYMRHALHEVFVTDPCVGCDSPDLVYWNSCPTEGDTHVRTLRSVGMTGFEWNIEPSFNCCWGSKFTITLTAEIPWIALGPTEVVNGLLRVSDPVCNLCNPCPVANPIDYDCRCLDQPVRVAPGLVDVGCFNPPLTVDRQCFLVARPSVWGNAALNMTVYSGDATNTDGSGLRNLRIRGWANPDGLSVDTDAIQCNEPCVDVEISCLPADATLVLDALTRRARITKNGQESRGARYLSSSGGQRFLWPTFNCSDLVLCVDADGDGTALNATLRVDVQEFQRA